MPLLGILNFAIAIYFGVHAVRTGRNMYWLIILLIAPFLGSLIYFFAEYLPELRQSSVARKSRRAVSAIVDPNRALREARQDFERTPTADNRARVAEALLARGDAAAAVDEFRQCASGPYAKDLKFRRGLARAQLAAGQHAQAVQTLEALFADEPQEARGDAALWYAQALAEVDEMRALDAFARARQAHETTETLAAYGLFLARLGRDAEARELLERVLHNARVGSATSRELNRDAIERARAALRTIEARGG